MHKRLLTETTPYSPSKRQRKDQVYEVGDSSNPDRYPIDFVSKDAFKTLSSVDEGFNSSMPSTSYLKGEKLFKKESAVALKAPEICPKDLSLR